MPIYYKDILRKLFEFIFSPFRQFSLNSSYGFVPITIIIAIAALLAIPITTVLVKQQQDIRQRAAGPGEVTTQSGLYNTDFCDWHRYADSSYARYSCTTNNYAPTKFYRKNYSKNPFGLGGEISVSSDTLDCPTFNGLETHCVEVTDCKGDKSSIAFDEKSTGIRCVPDFRSDCEKEGGTCTAKSTGCKTNETLSASCGDSFLTCCSATPASPTSTPVPTSNGGRPSCNTYDPGLAGFNSECKPVCDAGASETPLSGYTCPDKYTPEFNLSTPQVCCKVKKLTDARPPGTGSPTPFLAGRVTPSAAAGSPKVSCDGKCGSTRPASDATCPGGYSYNDNDPLNSKKDAACGGGNSYCWTCNSSGSNPGGGSPAPSPTPYIPGATAEVCANQGGVASYMQPLCNGEPFDASKVATAVKDRQYADRYRCANADASGKDYFDKNISFSSADNPCNKFPWYGPNSLATPVCKIDCKAQYGNNYSCSYDYGSANTRCCPDGKRYCSRAGTCVSDTQGCLGLLAGIGQTCGTDAQCEDFASGARCRPFGSSGINTCQWVNASGTPIPSPTPTPGAAASCVVGMMGTGCRCDITGGGCLTSHNCEPSYDGNSKSYCVPFPATQRWCERSKTLVSSQAACTGATPYTTPTPFYSFDCPGDGNHICAATSTSCPAPYSYKNSSTADMACSDYNPSTPFCCKKTATGTTLPTATPATGGLACPNTSTEQCQQQSTANGCLPGWTQTGKACTYPAVCCKSP